MDVKDEFPDRTQADAEDAAKGARSLEGPDWIEEHDRKPVVWPRSDFLLFASSKALIGVTISESA
jgi:hypothetical protein